MEPQANGVGYTSLAFAEAVTRAFMTLRVLASIAIDKTGMDEVKGDGGSVSMWVSRFMES